jgi:hypothetical protein
MRNLSPTSPVVHPTPVRKGLRTGVRAGVRAGLASDNYCPRLAPPGFMTTIQYPY